MTRKSSRPDRDEPDEWVEPTRPPLVWFILGWYLLGLVSGVFSSVIMAAGVIPLTEPQKRYFESLTALDYICSASVLVLNLTAAGTLVALRRVALPLFVAGLVLSAAATTYSVAATEWRAAMGPMASSAFLGIVVGWGVHVAVIFYARALVRRGVLK